MAGVLTSGRWGGTPQAVTASLPGPVRPPGHDPGHETTEGDQAALCARGPASSCLAVVVAGGRDGAAHGAPGGGRVSGPSGLVPNHQTATDVTTPDEAPKGLGCPFRRGMVYLNLETGESRPARCGRLSCGYCAERNAWRRSAAILLAVPERSITITLLADAGDSDPWQTARRRYRRTREWLKREGVDPGEWVVHVEPNPKQTGFHGHIWQHGRPVPKRALQEAAHHAGAGWTRIERVRALAGAASYGLKGMGYGLKGVAGESTATYLHVNGGRLTHQSPGFFRSQDVARLPVRQAEALGVRALLGESEGGTWTLATEAGAVSYRSLVPAAGRASEIPSTGWNQASG